MQTFSLSISLYRPSYITLRPTKSEKRYRNIRNSFIHTDNENISLLCFGNGRPLPFCLFEVLISLPHDYEIPTRPLRDRQKGTTDRDKPNKTMRRIITSTQTEGPRWGRTPSPL